MCSKTTNFAIGIIISVWTVVQTSFHVLWTLSGHYLYVCKIKPTHYLLVVFYLTYFYNSECGDITVESNDIFSHKKHRNTNLEVSDILNDTDVFEIVQLIVEKAQLPKEANEAFRTHVYMVAFLLLDGIWLLTAFLLFAGTCFQVKRKASLFFYVPWLVVTGLMILLDFVSSAHFGLDLLKLTKTYTSWLKFIGVSNYKDFTNLNDHPSSDYIPIESSIVLCVLCTRLIILLVLNIVNFSQILSITTLAYQDRSKEIEAALEDRRRRRQAADTAMNLNTSESRIRSWQLFYGAIETTSTASSTSLKSMERDVNSNTGRRKKTSFTDYRPTTSDGIDNPDDHNMYISSIRSPETTFETANSEYMKFPDVADVLEPDPRLTQRKISPDPLRNHMPWSYTTARSTIAESDDRTFYLSDSVDKNKRRTVSAKPSEEITSTAL